MNITELSNTTERVLESLRELTIAEECRKLEDDMYLIEQADNDLFIILTLASTFTITSYIRLLSCAGYFPSAWMRTLAYASLVLSFLAGFGAVLAKQWLNRYKTDRRRGLLKQRGVQRRMKIDKLEKSYLPAVLQAFFVFLLISMLLLWLSLSGNVLTGR